MSATVRDTALKARDLGYSVVPVLEDGTKAPAVKWKPYTTTIAQRATVEQWFVNGHGLGVVCGAVSGGLEMLELEGRAVERGLHKRFQELVQAAGIGDVLQRVLRGYTETTPSGGLHLLYRVADGVVPGNAKLAQQFDADTGETRPLIETRGEGGFVVIAPTGGNCHASGRPWVLKKGDLQSVATITMAERNELHAVARMLDERPTAPPREPTPATPRSPLDDDRPGDRLNAEGRQGFARLLERHGWTMVHERDGVDYWRRPGKTIGVSATVAEPGCAGRAGSHATLKVFSSSTSLDTERTYDLLGATAVLEHGGDVSAAARSLVDRTENRASTRASEDDDDAESDTVDRRLNLPPSFYEQRPELAHIRQAAHARGRSADAVLMVVLARVLAMTQHTVELPPIVGSAAPLNAITAIVQPSGGGKSTSNAAAGEVMPAASAKAAGIDLADDLPIGSGEGLAEVYMGHVPVDDAKPSGKTERRQVRHNAFVYVDEGQVLTDLGGRQGTTLLPTLRSAWSGATLGQTNADAARRRILPAGMYRLSVVLGFQVEKAAPLMSDAAGGTPQRFLFVAGHDPHLPAWEDTPPWPGPLAWEPPSAKQLAAVEVRSTKGYVRHHLRVEAVVADEIGRADRARTRGEVVTDELDSHANLVRLKVAASLAILAGRLEVTADDWRLAGDIWGVSVAVRAWIVDTAAAQQKREEVRTIEYAARKEMAVEAARQSAGSVVEKIAARLARYVADQNDPKGFTRRQLGQRLKGDERALLDGAIELAVQMAWLAELSGESMGRYGAGPSRPS